MWIYVHTFDVSFSVVDGKGIVLAVWARPSSKTVTSWITTRQGSHTQGRVIRDSVWFLPRWRSSEGLISLGSVMVASWLLRLAGWMVTSGALHSCFSFDRASPSLHPSVFLFFFLPFSYVIVSSCRHNHWLRLTSSNLIARVLIAVHYTIKSPCSLSNVNICLVDWHRTACFSRRHWHRHLDTGCAGCADVWHFYSYMR